jgi:hypothetical protein
MSESEKENGVIWIGLIEGIWHLSIHSKGNAKFTLNFYKLFYLITGLLMWLVMHFT